MLFHVQCFLNFILYPLWWFVSLVLLKLEFFWAGCVAFRCPSNTIIIPFFYSYSGSCHILTDVPGGRTIMWKRPKKAVTRSIHFLLDFLWQPRINGVHCPFSCCFQTLSSPIFSSTFSMFCFPFPLYLSPFIIFYLFLASPNLFQLSFHLRSIFLKYPYCGLFTNCPFICSPSSLKYPYFILVSLLWVLVNGAVCEFNKWVLTITGFRCNQVF